MRSYKIFVVLLLNFAFIAMGNASNINGVLWQPQVRDLAVSQEDWRALMTSIKKRGIDTLVLQWTKYDAAFKEAEEMDALLEKTLIAHKEGLKVIIGLSSENEFFNRQQLPLNELESYLNNLAYKDVKQLLRWQKRLTFEPSGWYISAEIDDYNWQDKERRDLLLQWLGSLKEILATLTNAPIYISSFFSGNMNPKDYQDLIYSIEQQGLKVWIQDGSGVNQLTTQQRLSYLNCNVGEDVKYTLGSGIIYEVFMIQENGEIVPKQMLDIVDIDNELKGCGEDKIIFSLRYLQNINNPLQYVKE